MARIVGIDLGTTNSLIAIADDQSSHILTNQLGARLTPSVVQFLPDGTTVVGEPAFRARVIDPEHTITGIKRFMGRTYNEVADLAESAPFHVVAGQDNRAVIRVYDRDHAPEEISALILRELRAAAEAHFGEPITDAVVTVPAYFNQAQRAATSRAAELAGLTVKCLVAEPTAAAFAYENERYGGERLALVLDLGGGTYDVTLSEIGDRVTEVVSINGDNYLGGDDFDRVLTDWAREEIRERHGVDLADRPRGNQRLIDEVTRVRCELSLREESSIRLPFLFEHAGRAVDIEVPINRALFEDITEELFERLVPPIEHALRDAGKKYGDIDEILLVGGATRMPRVASIVRNLFGREPRRRINPDEAVVLGAALQAGVLGGTNTRGLLLEVMHHSIMVEAVGGLCERVIPRHTTIPTRKTETFEVTDLTQTHVEVHLLEGEHGLAVNNRTIGRVTLALLPPSTTPRQVSVTIDIDGRRNIKVSVSELAEGGASMEVKLDYR